MYVCVYGWRETERVRHRVRETAFTESPASGKGDSIKNHLKQLRRRKTIYVMGLEAVGITSATVPIAFLLYLAGCCTSAVAKGSSGRGRSMESITILRLDDFTDLIRKVIKS